jgi:hypothetical protein
MEAAWRPAAQTGVRPDWMEPFARTINAARKYVVSSTLDRVDWNAELVRGDLKAVQQLKREAGKGLYVAGVKLPLALAELGLIDEYEFIAMRRSAVRLSPPAAPPSGRPGSPAGRAPGWPPPPPSG